MITEIIIRQETYGKCTVVIDSQKPVEYPTFRKALDASQKAIKEDQQEDKRLNGEFAPPWVD